MPEQSLHFSELPAEFLRQARDYFQFIVHFPKAPADFIRTLGPPSRPIFNRSLAFFSVGIVISLVIAHVSILLLPHEERPYYESQFDIGRIHVIFTVGLFFLAGLFWACFRVAGSDQTYAANLSVLAYLYAFMWPFLGVFNFVASRVFSAMLGTSIIIIPPWDMRSISQIEPTLANKIVLALILTVITAELAYLVYLYYAVFRALHRISGARAGLTIVAGLVIAYFASGWAAMLINGACNAATPLCEFF